MTENPECPTCSSEDTVRVGGGQRFGAWFFQQRHQCRNCGQRFLTWWEGAHLRKYESRSAVGVAAEKVQKRAEMKS